MTAVLQLEVAAFPQIADPRIFIISFLSKLCYGCISNSHKDYDNDSSDGGPGFQF
jgi:hypothetical protein